MGQPRIQLQNISKYYHSEASVTQALRKITLNFAMHEFVAITGESGSGKSTLLRIISGMDSFDEGEMYIDGKPTFPYDDDDWERYRREEIGFVFQDYSLIGHYSARDNIVSALLILGMDRREAVEQAERYLERVGLQEQAEQMASKLSSGQKQRLSIARALAKGTDIIVADEPTGNLDSETGEQIIRLLKELSKDHLVIMVTHNFEQVEPYITRKIRLHDGDLVLDVAMNQAADQGMAGEPEQETAPEQETVPEQEAAPERETVPVQNRDPRYIHRVATVFSSLNMRTQKGKAVLFTIFFGITALVAFLFIGELLMNADDRITKTYDTSAFADEERNRIVVRHQDQTPITEQDLKELNKIRHVTTVDQYDLVNDINYYYQENKDYAYRYGYSNYGMTMGGSDNADESDGSVEFMDNSHFMRSSTCISEKDLASGRLPEAREEVVLYSKQGEKALDMEAAYYLRNENAWGSNEYIQWNCKVVGILREPTEQVYFSPAMCQMLTAGMTCGTYTMHFYYDKRVGDLIAKDDFIPIIGENLTGDQMQVSTMYSAPADGYDWVPSDPILAFHDPDTDGTKNYLEIIRYDEEGEQEEPITISAANMDSETLHSSSGEFLAMSESLFTEYNDLDSEQASVYITSYAKTEEVLKAVQKAGYEAISTYQVSVTEYEEEKVTERLTIIAIAAGVLIVLLIAAVLILRSLMKIQIKDYFVMQSMGMIKKLMHRITYYEMGAYMALAVLFTVLLMHLLRFGVPLVDEMLYYYEWPGYLLFFAYNLITWLLTVTSFNHLLKGRMDE